MLVVPVQCQWSHRPTMPILPHSELATTWKEKVQMVARPLEAAGRQ
uniref:AGO904 n=1 Tax=Arundo donax TaxID=35708 RepID=A0A0A9CG69_ARUDO